MFLNPASSSSIFNENATSSSSSSLHRFSSKNENSVPFGMKTPHSNNNVKNNGIVKKSGQTTSTQKQQRRRRALGDISNKGGGSAAKAGGKNGTSGGLALKPSSTGLRLSSSSNNNNKNRQVKFSKSGGGIKSSKPSSSSSSSIKLQQKQQQYSSSSEYDGVFGVTTRWSNTNLDHDRPSPFTQLPKDEFDLSTTVQEEIRQHRLKERVRKEEEKEKRMEEQMKLLRMNDNIGIGDVTKDVDDLQQLLMDHCNIVEGEEDDEQEALWTLKTSPAWEEEEDGEEFDPTKERRLSGTDPVSLWGDILSP